MLLLYQLMNAKHRLSFSRLICISHGKTVKITRALSYLLFLLLANTSSIAQQVSSGKNVPDLIPFPKQLTMTGNDFLLDEQVAIVLDKKASAAEKFAAEELMRIVQEDWSVGLTIDRPSQKKIILSSGKTKFRDRSEGYTISVSRDIVRVDANDAAGLYYGVQTLTQLIGRAETGIAVKGVEISDWPDTRTRAIHYDTKHHQDTRAFVMEFIRELSRYKINMLVWEWEDKLAYESYPEVGAPGAFTIADMQFFTEYAQKYHIQLVPLVQGLGHASFILKWPRHAGAREIYASNFEFCPLKDSTYTILFPLWEEAIKATPGSSYIHIGSDETYELGACENCRKKAESIGTSGLYHLFIDKAAAFLEKKGRKVMVWESPMKWKQNSGNLPAITPRKGLVLTESYDFETPDLKYAKQAKALGYPVFAYDPNPGIEHLFLPYFYREGDDRRHISGSLEESYRFLTANLGKGVFDGMIRTSWDDSGLPMQAWTLQFVLSAAYSWNAGGPPPGDFVPSFFRNYYGDRAVDMDVLFRLLNEGSYYYSQTLERNVWHFGTIGKTHLPDLPRGDAVEYDPYWNAEYAEQVMTAGLFLKKMDTALRITEKNFSSGVRHRYDMEIFGSIALLLRHTAQTYLDLSSLESAVTNAHRQRFLSHDSTVYYLIQAESIVQNQLNRRRSVYDSVVAAWEKTRLPKGMSAGGKNYFFRQDRTRHFANRTPDMRYLVVDEDDLNLEEYLKKLVDYRQTYVETYLRDDGESVNDQWPDQ